MPMMENTTRLKTWVGEYSFAIDAGGTGAKTWRSNDGPIPAGSVITGGYMDVTTAFTAAANGEAAVSVEGANDLISATVVAGAPYSTTGRKDVIVDATGSTAIKTTAARSPALTISVAAITAGVAKLVLFYV